MIVKIFEEVKELPVVTITLLRDKNNPLRMHMMYCMYCGREVIQFQGNIVSVIPGGLPQDVLAMGANFIAGCTRCKTRYLLNGIA